MTHAVIAVHDITDQSPADTLQKIHQLVEFTFHNEQLEYINYKNILIRAL